MPQVDTYEREVLKITNFVHDPHQTLAPRTRYGISLQQDVRDQYLAACLTMPVNEARKDR
jgi:hypothetical protein